MEIRYLTGKEILAIHYTIMHRHQDMDQAGVKQHHEFDSMLGRPYTSLFGQEQFPEPLDKACCYYHSIANNHIFHNGNKRTALAVFITFLRLNGLNLDMTDSEAEEFTVFLATDKQFKTIDCIENLKIHVSGFIIERS